MLPSKPFYYLTTAAGILCSSTGLVGGSFFLTKEQVFDRIGGNNPENFRVYELVPMPRGFKFKLEIV